MVYTVILTGRGGFESSLTPTRLGKDRFLIVSCPERPQRDADWIGRRLAHACAVLTNASDPWWVISVMGRTHINSWAASAPTT